MILIVFLQAVRGRKDNILFFAFYVSRFSSYTGPVESFAFHSLYQDKVKDIVFRTVVLMDAEDYSTFPQSQFEINNVKRYEFCREN